ncbi:hypothetical protein DV515_00002973, partial [Chloebia gouldiae]
PLEPALGHGPRQALQSPGRRRRRVTLRLSLGTRRARLGKGQLGPECTSETRGGLGPRFLEPGSLRGSVDPQRCGQRWLWAGASCSLLRVK